MRPELKTENLYENKNLKERVGALDSCWGALKVIWKSIKLQRTLMW